MAKVRLTKITKHNGFLSSGASYDHKYGYIDKTGKEVIYPKYNHVEDFSEGIAKVRNGYKYGYINKTGEEITPIKYDEIGKFSEGLAKIKIDNNYGYIDKTGKEVVPCKYNEIGPFLDGLALVRNSSGYGYIDENGEEVISCKYSEMGYFSDGLALIRLNGKYGYINKAGKEIIPPKYNKIDDSSPPTEDKVDEIGDFSEGLVRVSISVGNHWWERKYGYMDKTGKLVIAPKYKKTEDFSDGLARVTLETDRYLLNFCIDKTGTKKYQSREMKIIWEDILVSHINKINNYCSKINKSSRSSGTFKIERPYILIKNDKSNDYKDMDISKYSEKLFEKQSINSLKTIIIQYDYLESSRLYKIKFSERIINVKNYGLYLIYFDVSTKECIGYDVMRAQKMPLETNYTEEMHNSFSDILEMIESHL